MMFIEYLAMGLHTMLSQNGVCRGARTLSKIKFSTSSCCVLSSESHRVIHDRQQRRFTIMLHNGGKVLSAVLKYSYSSDERVCLLSTEVPESFRGKGVAASLAKIKTCGRNVPVEGNPAKPVFVIVRIFSEQKRKLFDRCVEIQEGENFAQLYSRCCELVTLRCANLDSKSVEAALDFVVEENLKASISCWYIKKYVDENPHHGYQVHIED